MKLDEKLDFNYIGDFSRKKDSAEIQLKEKSGSLDNIQAGFVYVFFSSDDILYIGKSSEDSSKCKTYINSYVTHNSNQKIKVREKMIEHINQIGVNEIYIAVSEIKFKFPYKQILDLDLSSCVEEALIKKIAPLINNHSQSKSTKQNRNMQKLLAMFGNE